MRPEQLTDREVVVPLNTWDEVLAQPDERLTLATFDLTECTAVAILTQTVEGFSRAYLQHYHPDLREDSVEALQLAVERHNPINEDISRVVIMDPHTRKTDRKFDLEIKPINSELKKRLAGICIDGLGKRLDITSIPYTTTEFSQSYGAGTLVVELGLMDKNSIFAGGVPVVPKHFD